MRLLDAVCGQAWAIRPEALEAILALAARDDISSSVITEAMHVAHGPDAVAAKIGPKLDAAKTITIRDGVAILPVEGPIVRYASLFADVSGATSVETLSTDLTIALGDPSVHAILLHVDSPGGEVSGIAEFADRLFAARSQKPITAYVSDLGASAGYWLASAADQVVVAETAALGSIGVVMAVRDPQAQKAKEIEFVSSQSPNKRPNPGTESGKAQYQSLVDALGDVFVGAVARNRGVDPEIVLSDFGGGGLFIGQQAVDAGLADTVGSFEQTLRDLAEQTAQAPAAPPARPAGPGRKHAMGMREKFFAWLDGIEAEASSDQEAAIVSDTQNPPALPAPSSKPAASADDGELQRVRAELRASQAEAERLKIARIQDLAASFAAQSIGAEKAFPIEREALIAVYVQAALDDAKAGDGANRVSLLEAVYAVRPAHALTREQLNPAALQILRQQETTAKDPNAEPSPERVNELLSKTALGASIVNGRGN